MNKLERGSSYWNNMQCPHVWFWNWWKSRWTNGCLELYLKVLSIGFSWSTCVGFKESLCRPRCYSRNYPKIGHVSVELAAIMSWRRKLCDHSCLPSRHQMKRIGKIQGRSRLSQEWIKLINTQIIQDVLRDQVIPWYGKHCPLRFVY